MSKEWDLVLGRSHRLTPKRRLKSQLARFVTIPAAMQITEEDNASLLRRITDEEVTAAIRTLQRNKSAGPDGLGNDFYKDFEDLVTARLTSTFNGILHGEAMPATFGASLIVPLRKKGDSTNAMDYRPISLLNSSYKILAKSWPLGCNRF